LPISKSFVYPSNFSVPVLANLLLPELSSSLFLSYLVLLQLLKIQPLWSFIYIFLVLQINYLLLFFSIYHISNSEIYLRHVWLQYNIKSSQLFSLICIWNSISNLVLYNGLNYIKSLWLFCFIWVKIYNHIYFCLLSNYLLQTPQIYLDFTWSFPLFKSKLLYSVSLMKYSLRDLF